MTAETQAPDAEPKNRVKIFDTTMRDGEQSPGASMTLEEKLQITEALENLNVDIIEAGFPIASNGDFEAVTEVAKIVRKATVAGLARAAKRDIERAAEALKHAQRPRIHTFIATSPLHMKHKLQMAPEDVLDAITESVTLARNFTDDVQWSCEDGTRSEIDFLCRAIERALKAGATTINIPDTVGYAVPEEFGALIKTLFERVDGLTEATVATHCHNDLGLAVANSLAGVMNGARQVECTVNGLGERAGNAAMEEVVMALRTRADAMPYHTGINAEGIMPASRLVSAVTQFTVQPNKAIVGANAFAHESGIHQDGMLKNAQTYEIMTPESVGLHKSKLVLGKHSGRHAFREKLGDLAIELGENAFEDAFRRFKDLADKKKDVFDEDIVALVDDEVGMASEDFTLTSLRVVAGTEGPQEVKIVLHIDGNDRGMTSTGDGPVDAIFNAITKLVPHDGTLLLYQVHAVTEGTDAQAKVTVRLEEEGRLASGQAADTDTLVASAKAYVSALNKLVAKRGKTAPAALSA